MAKQTSSEAFEALKEYLIQNYGAKTASGGKEIVKRCHLCGDSRDKTDAHMYIGLKNGIIFYNCFKCNSNGIVNSLFLRNMGCYDPSIIMSIQEQINQAKNPNNTDFDGIMRSISLRDWLYSTRTDQIIERKFDYLEKRIGRRFDVNSARNFKIITDLKEFLFINKITKYTRYPDIMDLLSKYFIGFLSMDNRYIILRRVIPEGNLPKNIDMRYINYNIFNIDEGDKFYTIPGSICIDRPVQLHIAEGIMDILSVKLNMPDVGGNGIYSAVCGKSYSSLVRYYIIKYGLMNFDLHIYKDNDVNDYTFKHLTNNLSIYNINAYLHKNSYYGEKDFGCPKDRINDEWIRI